MNGELLGILGAIERDKGIDREILIQAVEGALASAAKKSLGVSETSEVTVTINRETGQLSVVSEDHVVSSLDFSRIAAQTAKQVIIQKIREAERDVIFTEYQERVGNIVTGTVHRFERGDIIVEMGRAEAILPRAERIPHEEYQQGDRLQGYVVEVRKSVKGPAIVLSRTHEGFIRGLFSLEVPEINEGIVEMRGIAREAGDRTKIAVASTDEKVDCVGACVGMRGTRVKNIVRELHGEKIDIIRWQEDIKEFIGAALSPAKIVEIRINPESKQALVLVDDDQLSLAIGKRGQNVRLAAKLTGWELEIQSKVQLVSAGMDLGSVPGVGPAMNTRLQAAGITTVQQLAGLTLTQLTNVKGVGEKTAQRLIDSARQALATKAASTPEEAPAAPEDAGTSPPDTVPPVLAEETSVDPQTPETAGAEETHTPAADTAPPASADEAAVDPQTPETAPPASAETPPEPPSQPAPERDQPAESEQAQEEQPGDEEKGKT